MGGLTYTLHDYGNTFLPDHVKGLYNRYTGSELLQDVLCKLRKEKNLEECEKIIHFIKSKITDIPGNVLIEFALVFHMLGYYEESVESWKEAKLKIEFSVFDFSRYLLSVIAINDLNHAKVISEDFKRAFGETNELNLICQYISGVEYYVKKEWIQAKRCFEFVKLTKTKHVSPPIRYYLKSLDLNIKLQGCKNNSDIGKQLNTYKRWSEYRLAPEDFAGLGNILNFYGLFNTSVRQEVNKYVECIINESRLTDIDLVHHTSKKFHNSVVPLLKLLREIDLAYFPPEFLLTLANLAFCVKDLSSGNYFRSLCRSVLASLEVGPRFSNKTKLKNAKNELAIALGESIQNYDFVNKSGEWSSEKLGGLIQHKSIAVVGPINNKLPSGDEIDSFDIVFRFNFDYSARLDPNFFGSRTDISLYADQTLMLMRKNKGLHKLAALKAILYRGTKIRDSKTEMFEGIDDYKELHGRMIKVAPMWEKELNPLFKGFPNAIQIAIYELLRYQPSKIKIFNANLYISNAYDSSYRVKTALTPHLLVWHDLVSNYMFLKNLRQSGLLFADKVLDEILCLNEVEYIERLIENIE